MLVSFRSDKDKKKYEDQAALSKAHGVLMAKKIIQRISEIQAAPNPQKLPPSARFHEHGGNRKGLFSLDLVHPFRLIIRPTNKYDSYVEITEVEIYEIIDPH